MAALLVSSLPLTAQAASQAEAVLNSAGGNTSSDGLRIHYGNGQLQVSRNGANQMYHPDYTPGSAPTAIYNAIALSIEGTAYTPESFPFIAGSAFANTTQSGGSASSGTITGNLDTGVAGFDVDVTITYTSPDDYFNVTLVVDRGATIEPLKLYHFLDSYLAGADEGPGFFTAGPATVGVAKPGTVEAFRYVSGPAWTGYLSDWYYAPWQLVQDGDNFDNTINADPETDNGFGIMWDLGTAAGTHTVSYDMIFITDALPVPNSMVAPTAVAGDTTATMSLTAPLDNGSAITGYTVTAAPGGATCTVVTATSCVVPGLTNGTAYTFTATATNGNGTSTASPASNSVTPTAPAPGPDPTPTPTTNPIFDVGGSGFTDIPAGEMAVAASWLASQGITLGCEGGASPRFCPNDLATRAEVATFLTRALGLPATDVDAFRDDNGHLLEDGLNRAAAADIFLGCSNDRDVCPDDTITRGELAAVLVRALGLVASNPAAFSDVDQHWAQSFIRTIGGLGISVGCESGGDQFCPEDFGTRGEIALFLYRALTLE